MDSARVDPADNSAADHQLPKSDQIPALDGLRGIAVAAVLLFHGAVDQMQGGFLGVDLFFVVSGFLITQRLLIEAESAGRIDIVGFYGRRVRRLVPALLVVVLAVVAFAAIYSSAAQTSLIQRDALGAAFYVHNWVQIAADQSYFAEFGEPSPLRHLWSLAVEEQWYLVWPLVVALCLAKARDPRRAILVTSVGLAVISAVAMVWLQLRGAGVNRLYYGTDTRLQTVAIGSALGAVRFGVARVVVRAVVGSVSAAIAIAMMVTVSGSEQWLYRGGLSLFAIAAVGLVWVSVQAGAASRVLSATALVLLGRQSYSLYLWHWPVFVGLNPSSISLTGWRLLAVRLAVSLALAVVTYLVVEQPVRHRRPGFALVGGLLGATVLLGAVAGFGLSGIEGDDEQPSLAIPKLSFQSDDPLEVVPPTSLAVGQQERQEVLVVGDSIAKSFSLFVNVEHSGAEFGLQNGGFFGCGLISSRTADDAIGDAELEPSHHCFRRFEIWDALIRSHQPAIVLVMVGGWEVFDLGANGEQVALGSEEWADAIASGLASIKASADAVDSHILIATVPCFAAKDLALPGDTTLIRNDASRVAAVNAELVTFAANSPGVDLLDIDSIVCPGGEPLGELGGSELRPDGVHFSPEGAAQVWTAVVPTVHEFLGLA